MKPSPLPAGAQLGPYRLTGLVTETATAQVYEATDGAGARRAIKLSTAASAGGAEPRFRHEIDVLLRVDHRNVIPLVDHGVAPGGRPYLVTPWIEGPTLRELLAGVTLCPEAALLLLRETALGLAALHDAGLVHRDLKPENLMLTADGQLVIIDLGLAFAPDHTRYTEEGAVVGSVPYMSPEQIEGRALAPESDLWSLAVIGYEWITGARPFQRERQSEEVAAILSGRYRSLAEADRRAPTALTELVVRCLQLEPTARPAHAGAVAEELAGEIDWMGGRELAGELASLATNPSGYIDRVLPVRIALAVNAAEAALAAGDSFAASRALDRGLAYAPDDPRLNALVDRVLSSQPPVVPPAGAGEPRANRLRPAVVLGLLGLLVAAIAVVAVVTGGQGSAPTAPGPATAGESDPSAPPAAAGSPDPSAPPVVLPPSPVPTSSAQTALPVMLPQSALAPTPAPPAPPASRPPNQAYEDLPPGMPLDHGSMLLVQP